MHRTPFRFSELHNSHFLHGCSPHKLNHENRDMGGGQETEDYLEWPNKHDSCNMSLDTGIDIIKSWKYILCCLN